MLAARTVEGNSGSRKAALGLCGLFGGATLIRQAISCDICGNEKKQTNHWFVAYDQGGELRVSGWDSRNRLRPGTKHLCGQTCLHKLVDEFMAKAILRPQPAVVDDAEAIEQPRVEPVRLEQPKRMIAATDTSLTSRTAYTSVHADVDEYESSARLITKPDANTAEVIAPAAALARASGRPLVELVAAAARRQAEESAQYAAPSLPAAPLPEEAPRFASRNWRAEAWEREREREQRTPGRHSGIVSRHRSNP